MTDVSPELAVDQSPHPTSSPDLLTAREHHRYCPRSQPAPSESPSSSFGFLHQRASPHSGDLILSEAATPSGYIIPETTKPITKAGGQSIESPCPRSQSRRWKLEKPPIPESKTKPKVSPLFGVEKPPAHRERSATAESEPVTPRREDRRVLETSPPRGTTTKTLSLS
ncbi:hypothetical protein Rs2_48851 [Raphanus sativus]|nr:hypothetical protein Rs2_48851 [Raphanus sativus]